MAVGSNGIFSVARTVMLVDGEEYAKLVAENKELKLQIETLRIERDQHHEMRIQHEHTIAELRAENAALREEIAKLTKRLEHVEKCWEETKIELRETKHQLNVINERERIKKIRTAVQDANSMYLLEQNITYGKALRELHYLYNEDVSDYEIKNAYCLELLIKEIEMTKKPICKGIINKELHQGRFKMLI